MDIKKIVKKHLFEALGVPNNITNVANDIYKKMIIIIDQYNDIDMLSQKPMEINGDFQISDFHFNKIKIEFDINVPDDDEKLSDDVNLAGMQTSRKAHLTNKLTIKSQNNTDNLNLLFRFFLKKTTSLTDIKNYLYKNYTQIVSTFSHELKHMYDNYKNPEKTIKSSINYDLFSNYGFEVKPLNEFIFNMYFTHRVENLVRPSELASKIESGQITRKNFYNFIINENVYKTLKKISSMTLDGYKESIKNDIENVKIFLNKVNVDYSKMNDDEIVDETLRLVYVNMTNWKNDVALNRLTTSIDEMLFGLKGEKKEFIKKLQNEMLKYKDDYHKFFDMEIKKMNKIAFKMIKKISKLYDMTKQEQNESIIDPDLWYKYFVNQNDFQTEL